MAELLAIRIDALGTRSGKLGPRGSAHLASGLQSAWPLPHPLGTTLVTVSLQSWALGPRRVALMLVRFLGGGHHSLTQK